MQKSGKIILIVAVITALSFGFIIGQQVQASSQAPPGSQNDPLVAKSYVEEQLEAKVTELEAEIERLTTKANQLQLIVDELVKKVQ
ncbi:MAG: hypothetical protein SCK28_07480 [Bacillota bacterium]|nr:hypothetical protein [Bacillota bacterium]